MKRGILFSILIVLFIISFVIAENETEVDINLDASDDDQSKIDKAYICLENKVEDKCSSISLEERIFSLLALGTCKSEILSDSKYKSDVKLTAQAILALDEVGSSTDEAEEWLLSQKSNPNNLIWYLQIESTEATTCTITYSGSSHQISIGDDKKINSGAGSCLSLSEGGWWLRVSSTCSEEEFDISCTKAFQTNLLYKKQTSSTIYVSEKTNSASAEGTTTETINSLCFAQGGTCDYEGSLWATLVLDYLDEDISPYIPYLTTMADDNSEYLPESFLYLLTSYSEFRSDLLLKQKGNYWDESGDKFYDTALALYPFQYEEPQEKTNSKDWLLEVQDKDGCWGGNIRNTAFILYSVWPEDVYEDDGGIDCEDAGYYCMSEIDCDGSFLSHDCAGIFRCCDTPKSLETCMDQGGEICNSDEDCVSGTTFEASDTTYGQICCVGGSCEIPPQETECKIYGGICRTAGCNDGEEEISYECEYSSDSCCVDETEPGGNYLWIWIILILIVLVVIGILFKDKLRRFWIRMKSKFGKGKPGPKPKFPQPQFGMQRPILGQRPRRILPPSRRHPPKIPKREPQGELTDVLKKLKEMGQ